MDHRDLMWLHQAFQRRMKERPQRARMMNLLPLVILLMAGVASGGLSYVLHLNARHVQQARTASSRRHQIAIGHLVQWYDSLLMHRPLRHRHRLTIGEPHESFPMPPGDHDRG